MCDGWRYRVQRTDYRGQTMQELSESDCSAFCLPFSERAD